MKVWAKVLLSIALAPNGRTSLGIILDFPKCGDIAGHCKVLRTGLESTQYVSKDTVGGLLLQKNTNIENGVLTKKKFMDIVLNTGLNLSVSQLPHVSNVPPATRGKGALHPSVNASLGSPLTGGCASMVKELDESSNIGLPVNCLPVGLLE